MAIDGVVRYEDLLSNIPKGSFYDCDGKIIPYYSKPRKFRLETPAASMTYALYINELYSGEVTSDLNGNVEFFQTLPLGEISLKMVNKSTGRAFTTYLTCRSYATWLSAHAEALEVIDDNIQRVYNAMKIERVGTDEIEEVFGSPLGVFMDFGNIGLNSYRNLVHELRLGYRNFGGTFRGLDTAICSFTQVPPFGYSRRKWGPNWRAGSSLLKNGKFSECNLKPKYLTGVPGYDDEVEGVTLVGVEPGHHASGCRLTYTHATKHLSWVSDVHAGSDGGVYVSGSGRYFITNDNLANWSGGGAMGWENGDRVVFKPGPYNISSSHRNLCLNILELGEITIPLTVGMSVTASTLATDINAALAASPIYGGAYSIAYESSGTLGLSVPIWWTTSLTRSEFMRRKAIQIVRGLYTASGAYFSLVGRVNPGESLFSIPPGGVTGRKFVLKDVWGDSVTRALTLRVQTPTETGSVARVSAYFSGAWYGPTVHVHEDGVYSLSDSLGNSILFEFNFLGVPHSGLSILVNFTVYPNLVLSPVYGNTGIWVDVDYNALPNSDRQGYIDIVPETAFGHSRFHPPDWFLEGNSSGWTSSSYVRRSPKNTSTNGDGSTKSFMWTVTDSASTDVSIIGRVEKFPVFEDLPRGSLFPNQSFGGVYDYVGYEMKFCGHVRAHFQTTDVTPSISFDGGDSWVDGSVITVLGTSNHSDTTYFEFKTKIPLEVFLSSSNFLDSSALVKLNFQAASIIAVDICELDVKIEHITSSSLGNATVPRSRHRQYFGELLYMWSKEPLSLIEKKYLGVFYKKCDKNSPFSGININNISLDTLAGPGFFELEYSPGPVYRFRWTSFGDSWSLGSGWTPISGSGNYTIYSSGGSSLSINVIYDILPSYPGSSFTVKNKHIEISDLTSDQGHSRFISSAHSSLDVIDISEYDSLGQCKNLKGVVDESDFTTCSYKNLDIAPMDPFKFSHLFPTVGRQEGERLVFSPSGLDYESTLLFESTADQDYCVLYADGVPVPNDEWYFTDNWTVEMSGTDYNPSSDYTLDYDVLYQVETGVIDLGNEFEDYVWLADHCLYERQESEKGEYDEKVPVYFDRESGRALLDNPSTKNKSIAKLTLENGRETIEIPYNNWRFVTDLIIQIDSISVSSGQYYLTHKVKRVYERSNIDVVFEHCSSEVTTPGGFTAWKEISRNEAVSTEIYSLSQKHRYHKLRLTISKIRDTKDFRIKSLVLKGLHLYGPDKNVPGITNIWSKW
jgi:hypothetical protein